jgi:hypothetical protein
VVCKLGCIPGDEAIYGVPDEGALGWAIQRHYRQAVGHCIDDFNLLACARHKPDLQQREHPRK